MKTIAFFNNKGGVGKTSLVYHLAWMYAELGATVVVADFDPQANLTGMFLGDERLAELWAPGPREQTVFGAIRPLIDGTGDIAVPHVEPVAERIGLLVGDLALSATEDELAKEWPNCLDRKPRAFRVLSALWRVIEAAAVARDATVALIDVGPNLGALNRAALIAADYVVVPLAPDLFSLHGMRNLGPTLRRWRTEWSERRARNPVEGLAVPVGDMRPAGYVVMQHAVRLDRPVQAYERWMEQIPGVYRSELLDERSAAAVPPVASDPHCLAQLKHYRSLMPLAQAARKPMFKLTSADGAFGGHAAAAQSCEADFRRLAQAVAQRCGVALP